MIQQELSIMTLYCKQEEKEYFSGTGGVDYGMCCVLEPPQAIGKQAEAS